jgi:hypothetical protein
MRYTLHLVPLLVILGAAALPRKWYLVVPMLALLVFQAFGSIRWMHSRVAQVAPVQEQRIAAGEWIHDNIPADEWVISSDIGAIGYKALDHQFVDLNYLVSRETINDRKPGYLADTFALSPQGISYPRIDLSGASVLFGEPCTDRLAIAIVRINPW